MRNRALFVSTTAAALGLSAAAAVFAQNPTTKTERRAVPEKVTGFKPAAAPKTYTGKCPVTVHFSSIINTNHRPVTIEYEWVRSDGAKGPKQTATITNQMEVVRDTWELGGAGEHKTIWEKVHVLSPNNISSGEATARLNCSK